MKYALLIHTDQAAWADLYDEEKARAPRRADAEAGSRSSRSSGRPTRTSAATSSTRARRRRSCASATASARHRRPVRRDEGGHRRRLPHRPPGSRRGDPARLAHPDRGAGLDRDPADRRVRRIDNWGVHRASSRSFARNGAVPSPSSPASSVTSSSPRTRCRTRSRPRSSAGRATACPGRPAHGSSRPRATARSTASAATASSARRRSSSRGSSRFRRGEDDVTAIPDDRLALVFTCCHPALAAESRVALTLREVGGLTTTEIAHAFLVSEPAMAQRLVRAKRKIRTRRDPVPRAARPPAPRAPALRARGPLPRLQRGVRRDRRLRRRARRPLRRGDPAREAARRPHAGRARGARAARADAPPGLAPCRAGRPGRRARPARGPGSLPLEPRPDRGGAACARAGRRAPAAQARTSSRRRSRPRTRRAGPGARSSSSTTGSSQFDPSPVVALNRAVAVALSGRVEDGLALVDRLDGLDELPPPPRRPRRSPPAPRPPRRGCGRVPARDRADRERGREPLPRAAATRGLVAPARRPRRASPRSRSPPPRERPPARRRPRPSSLANAISASVPQLPPTAITASPEAATARLRACPIPVTTTWSAHSFAASRSSPGRIAIVVPPADFAPRCAAAITSPSPPVTTAQPRSASRRPTSSAAASHSAPLPITATWRATSRSAKSLQGLRQRLLPLEHARVQVAVRATRSSTASIVKEARSSPAATSSQRSGVETGAPARGRTE